ncbi:uncharacterized protein DS421_17g586900 [Arachis hypogaea]|nr:uncharacterized protein DS421_17g586900 [Arachis hypogaea]
MAPLGPSRRQIPRAVSTVAPSAPSRPQLRRALSSVAPSATSTSHLRPSVELCLWEKAIEFVVNSVNSDETVKLKSDERSLVEFDRAIELDPRQKAYLWQRGLSLYYLDRFEEGAEQFRLDVAQNSNDTEESICCFLCEAQLYGVDEARKRYLKQVMEDFDY